MKKFFFASLLILLACVGVYIYLSIFFQPEQLEVSKGQTLAPGQSKLKELDSDPKGLHTETKSTKKTTAETKTQTATLSTPQSAENIDGSSSQFLEMKFDGKTFSPATLQAKKGDYVFIENTSKKDMTIISIGGGAKSLNSSVINPGEKFKVQLNQTGSFTISEAALKTVTATITVK